MIYGRSEPLANGCREYRCSTRAAGRISQAKWLAFVKPNETDTDADSHLPRWSTSPYILCCRQDFTYTVAHRRWATCDRHFSCWILKRNFDYAGKKSLPSCLMILSDLTEPFKSPHSYIHVTFLCRFAIFSSFVTHISRDKQRTWSKTCGCIAKWTCRIFSPLPSFKEM